MNINYEDDRVESVKQIDAAASLSDKVIELKSIEDEIEKQKIYLKFKFLR
jgi:predicted fused transcriptional regulator/phosphomethylpyrimidine kinase